MKNKKMKILVYILSIIPIITTAIFYHKLPEYVPIQWQLNGDIKYGSKSSILIFTIMPIVLAFMYDVLPHIDPKKKNYAKFNKYYDGFCLVMTLFLLLAYGMTFSESLNPGKINVEKNMITLCGLLFLYIGNIMPKIKSNFFMGFKNPWTLSDETVWNKTHSLGGKLMFILGLFMLIANFFLDKTFLLYCMIFMIVLICIIPTIMSYLWFRAINKNHK